MRSDSLPGMVAAGRAPAWSLLLVALILAAPPLHGVVFDFQGPGAAVLDSQTSASFVVEGVSLTVEAGALDGDAFLPAAEGSELAVVTGPLGCQGEETLPLAGLGVASRIPAGTGDFCPRGDPRLTAGEAIRFTVPAGYEPTILTLSQFTQGNGFGQFEVARIFLDGAFWADVPGQDSGTVAIPLPAGAQQVTVNMTINTDVAPVSSDPAAVIAALAVRSQDTEAPRCPITANRPGPPAQLEVTVSDSGSGLASILVTRSENADTVVPPFASGTTDPVVVTATKIDPAQRSRVEMRVTDLAGNVALCDPIHLLMTGARQQAVIERFDDVPQAEHVVTITNGTPGLFNLEVRVNGVRYKLAKLQDGEERSLDISAALLPGDRNVVRLRATGKPGAWATVMLWDGGDE